MSGTTLDLAREAVRAIARYAPDAGPQCTVDVSDNTNLWGMPPAALRALQASPNVAGARYPALYGTELKEAVARYVGHGVAAEQVVAGCGSDDVLDAAMRAFGEPGSRIAYMVPTFSMIPVFGRLNGMVPVEIPYDPSSWDLAAERLLEARAAITYLCAPNNPTATGVSRAALEQVVRGAEGIVVVDEAYAEFTDTTAVDLVASHERLLVTRTLSKAFGLAGLRVGYGVASPTLAGLVERAIGPYKVNAIAERCALATLAPGADGLDWVRAHAALAVETRGRLAARLQELGLAPLPSTANFVLVPHPRAVAIGAALRDRGILVRAFGSLAVCGPALRIGVGPWEQMTTLCDALAEVLATIESEGSSR